VGYLPYAPGTYASILGCILIYFSPPIFGNILFSICFSIGLILFSVVCINLFKYEGEDPGYIVIDELAGICVTMAGHRITPLNLVIGFFLFRVFDIMKPYPIKHAERLTGGYGIVADDVVAGIFASVILIILGKVL
jgi:phosphatidylglycerophosphatase A